MRRLNIVKEDCTPLEETKYYKRGLYSLVGDKYYKGGLILYSLGGE
jgi:hypothetical protein